MKFVTTINSMFLKLPLNKPQLDGGKNWRNQSEANWDTILGNYRHELKLSFSFSFQFISVNNPKGIDRKFMFASQKPFSFEVKKTL